MVYRDHSIYHSSLSWMAYRIHFSSPVSLAPASKTYTQRPSLSGGLEPNWWFGGEMEGWFAIFPLQKPEVQIQLQIQRVT